LERQSTCDIYAVSRVGPPREKQHLDRHPGAQASGGAGAAVAAAGSSGLAAVLRSTAACISLSCSAGSTSSGFESRAASYHSAPRSKSSARKEHSALCSTAATHRGSSAGAAPISGEIRGRARAPPDRLPQPIGRLLDLVLRAQLPAGVKRPLCELPVPVSAALRAPQHRVRPQRLPFRLAHARLSPPRRSCAAAARERSRNAAASPSARVAALHGSAHSA
jgi:hypothetical protein